MRPPSSPPPGGGAPARRPRPRTGSPFSPNHGADHARLDRLRDEFVWALSLVHERPRKIGYRMVRTYAIVLLRDLVALAHVPDREGR